MVEINGGRRLICAKYQRIVILCMQLIHDQCEYLVKRKKGGRKSRSSGVPMTIIKYVSDTNYPISDSIKMPFANDTEFSD